jgi:hypothetical protein
VPHFLNVIHIRPDQRKKGLEFGAAPKPFQVPLFGIPFEPENETGFVFAAMGEFVRQAILRGSQRFGRFAVASRNAARRDSSILYRVYSTTIDSPRIRKRYRCPLESTHRTRQIQSPFEFGRIFPRPAGI